MTNYRFNKNSKISSILLCNEAIQIINRLCPFLLFNPILKYASNYPIRIIKYVTFDSSRVYFNKKIAKRIIKEICKIEK